MSFIDKLADLLDTGVEPTISDDAHSRLARRDQMERERIQKVEYDDDDGNEQLWFDVSFTVGTQDGVPMAWPGKDVDDVNAAVIEWLNTAEFRTVDLRTNGKMSKLTFRTSFVAHWEVGAGRRRA